MSQLGNTSRYIAIRRDMRYILNISRYIDISIKTKLTRYRNRFQISSAIFDNIVVTPKLSSYEFVRKGSGLMCLNPAG